MCPPAAAIAVTVAVFMMAVGGQVEVVVVVRVVEAVKYKEPSISCK